MTTICQVCDIEEKKYNCPACKILYCSLNCFKNHKENGKCEEETKRIEEAKPKFVVDTKPGQLIAYETIDTVPVAKLKLLGESDELKEILKNPHLRNYLKEINAATKPWNAMKIAMTEPLFLEFADVCLKIVQDQEE